MPKPFKKNIANFSGGLVTIIAPRDLSESQFQAVADIIADKIGKVEGAFAPENVSAEPTGGANPAIGDARSGKGLIAMRSDYTIHDTPAETPTTYWIFVGRGNSGSWDIFYYNQGDGTGGTWLRADDLDSVDALGWGTTDLEHDVLSINQSIRCSDTSFSKTARWFGHTKKDMFGNGLPRLTAPNYSTSNINYNEWSCQDQHLAPPTLIKMETCHDLTGQVRNSGEVGIYVHDPMKYRGMPGNNFEEIAFPLTINQTTGTFKRGDRYACTFEYDGVQESELSRNSKGELGVSGFDVIETDSREIEIATYPDSSSNDVDITVIDVTSPASGHAEAGDYAYSELHLKATSADYGAHKTLSPGDYIMIGSEVMLVTHLDSNGSGFSTNKVPVFVHRGVNDTKPLKDTELEGESVFRYPSQQRARAINLVLNKGVKTQSNISVTENTTIFSGDDSIDSIALYVNNALGTNGQKYRVIISSDSASGSPTVTVTKEIAHTLDSAGSGSALIDIKFAIHNGSSVNVTKQDFANLLNNGTNAAGNIAGSSNTIAVTNACKINLPDLFSANVFGTNRNFNNSVGAQTITLNGGTADDSPTLNPRISAVKLYWQPEGEPDFFLVDRYDIDKGYTGSQFAKRNNYPQVYDRKYMEADGSYIGSDFGAWIDCPFWHYNSHNTSGLVTIPFESAVGDGKAISAQHGSFRGVSSTGGVQYGPWEDRAAVNDIILTAPIAASNITDTATGENDDFVKKFGKFNQLRTNYAHIKSICTKDAGSDVEHFLSWGDGHGKSFDGGISEGDNLEKKWDSSNNRLYIGGMATVDFNRYGWVAGNYIIVAGKSGGAEGGVTDAEWYGMDAPWTFNYSGDGNVGNVKQSPYGIFKISANTSDYLTIDNATTPVPTGWSTDDTFRAHIFSGWSMTNHFGASMVDNARATMLDASPSDIAVGENIGMEAIRNAPRYPHNIGSAYDYAQYLSGYEMVTATPRKDAVSTFYRPFIGEKLFTYQSLTGRTGSTRIKPTKWACSEPVGNFVVIGNVDTEDDNEQTVREASRIMWTLPNRFDDFCILRSKEIFSIDGGVITNLKAIGNILYVIKTNNAYALDMSKNFSIAQSFLGFGSPYTSDCCAKTPMGLVIVNDKGVYLLPSMEEISYVIRDEWQAATFARPVVGYHSERDELFIIGHTEAESSTDSFSYIYNLRTKSWRKENIMYYGQDTASDDVNITNLISQDRQLQYASWDAGESSFVVKKLYSSSTKVSSGELWTKDFIFNAPARFKSVTNLVVTSSGAFDIDFYINGDKATSHKKISIASHGTGVTKSRLYKVNIECRSLSMKITSGTDFSIEDISLEGYVSDKF